MIKEQQKCTHLFLIGVHRGADHRCQSVLCEKRTAVLPIFSTDLTNVTRE